VAISGAVFDYIIDDNYATGHEDLRNFLEIWGVCRCFQGLLATPSAVTKFAGELKKFLEESGPQGNKLGK
jgi:hypothetical protein